MSLTFTPRPPLAPPSHLQLAFLSPELDISSPPLSPFIASPPLSADSQPGSPFNNFPTDIAMRGTRAVPAPRLFPAHEGPTRDDADPPFNTPNSPRRAPILTPTAIPNNYPSPPTNSDRIDIGSGLRGGGIIGASQRGNTSGVPSSLSTPLGGLKPLNAASAMRGRGLTNAFPPDSIGSGAPGPVRAIGIPHNKANEVPHAFTPGNTPSSMERVSKRMASNLMVGNQGGGGSSINRIVPSYDRRFSAGLQDLGNRLDEHVHAGIRSPPPSIPASMNGANPAYLGAEKTSLKADWPSAFSEASEDETMKDIEEFEAKEK